MGPEISIQLIMARLPMNRALFKVNRDEWRGFGLFKFMNRLKLVYSNSWIDT